MRFGQILQRHETKGLFYFFSIKILEKMKVKLPISTTVAYFCRQLSCSGGLHQTKQMPLNQEYRSRKAGTAAYPTHSFGFDPGNLQGKIVVEDGEAFEVTRLMAQKEGVFVGLSSGAAMAGALRVAEKMSKGTVVVILPDRGDRYLSVTQFRSICAKCPP